MTRWLRILLIAMLSMPVAAAADDPASPGSIAEMSLEQLMSVKVVSAALHTQALEDAPASVTVITAADIRKFGYRTLGEALDSVRGFYVTTDRAYSYLGARGLSTPGDFGSRYLLLIDGNSLSDSTYDSAGYLEQDLPVELDVVKQIEIVRGPASALYGNSSVLCTINVITRRPSEMPRMTVRTEVDSHGEKKLAVSYSGQWKGVQALFSGAVFNSSGEHSIYVPGYDRPDTNFGRAIDQAGQRGYHFFSSASWRNWTFRLVSGVRLESLPVVYGDGIFNDRGNRGLDSSSFAEAQYAKAVRSVQFNWRISYNQYRYHGRYDFALADSVVEDNRQEATSDWITTKLTVRFDARQFGNLTVGTETRMDVRNLLMSFDLQPVPLTYASIDRKIARVGFFLQDEIPITSHWKAVVGARFDTAQYLDNSLSPRAALIWTPSPRTAVKFLYGTSFRNPTAYEMLYGDGFTQIGNLSLHPERGRNFELALDRHLRAGWTLSLSAYRTDLKNLIVAGLDAGGRLQFQNFSNDRLLGVDAELAGRIGNVELAASFASQHGANTSTRHVLPNAPRQVGKMRFAVPLFKNRLTAAGIVKWLSRREDLNGDGMPSVIQQDLTLTTSRLTRAFDLQAGVRNVSDRRIFDPVALNDTAGVLPRPRREIFLCILWRTDD